MKVLIKKFLTCYYCDLIAQNWDEMDRLEIIASKII